MNHRTFRKSAIPTIRRYVWVCISSPGFWIPIGMYFATLGLCVSSKDDGTCHPPARLDYDHYWPTVMSAVAVFVLVFYLNQVHGRFDGPLFILSFFCY